MVPLASGLVNGVSPIEWITATSYQICAWGVPYLVGRLYFADPAGMNILARAVIGGGVVYVPFCLVENVAGPIVYHALYGGTTLSVHRGDALPWLSPGRLHGGRQSTGIWMASAALAAAWLWRSGQLSTFWRMPGSFVASLLVTTSFLTQSVGAVIFLVGALVAIELVWRVDRRWPIIVALSLPLVFVGARAANLFDAKALAQRTSLASLARRGGRSGSIASRSAGGSGSRSGPRRSRSASPRWAGAGGTGGGSARPRNAPGACSAWRPGCTARWA